MTESRSHICHGANFSCAAAHPFYVLAPHHNIDFAAPNGPNPPLDPNSKDAFSEDPESIKFLDDDVVKAKFEGTKYLKSVNADDYDAIFFVGGCVRRMVHITIVHWFILDMVLSWT